MTTFVSQHKGAVLVSVVLHVAVAAVLTLNLRLPSWRQPMVTVMPIEGVIIDTAVLEREQERREQVQRQETQRIQREERQKREAEDAAKRAVEQRQRDQAAAAKREQDRVLAEKAKAEQAERDRIAATERVAQEKREREAEEQRKRAEADKLAREQRARQQAEKDLQDALRAEQARTAAEQAGLLDQYIADITNKIERSWVAPLSAKAGLNCLVTVVQIPSGDVMDVRVANCNGDEAVVRSIEAAVRKASPLPLPRDPALFERNLNVTFRPNL